MNQNRCPWCGKKTNITDDIRRGYRKKKITPRYFTFAQCSNCNNYYGHNLRSKRIKFCLYSCIFVILLSIILQCGYLLFSIIIFCLVAITDSYERLDANEKYISYDRNLEFKAVLLETHQIVRKNQMYFLSKLFDECETFDSAPPFVILEKDGEQVKKGYFLYDFFNNSEYKKINVLEFYDSDMNLIGKIQFFEV